MRAKGLNRPIYVHLRLHDQNFSIFSITIIDTIKTKRTTIYKVIKNKSTLWTQCNVHQVNKQAFDP